MPKSIIIAAMSEDRVIGIPGGMPWDIPEEYAHYLHAIRDQTVIMGRVTFDIFGVDLTSRHALVISRSLPPGPGHEGYRSLEAARNRGQDLGRTVFVAGGASVYSQALTWVDEMWLSVIKGAYQGSVYFPDFSPADWEITQRTDHAQFELVQYQRGARSSHLSNL
jgi:dihydrofolate reductase